MASRDFHRQVFDLSPDPIFIESHDGRILEANDAACRLHGEPAGSLRGRRVTDLVPEELRGLVERDFQKWVTGEMDRYNGVSTTRDGRRIPVEIHASHIMYGDEPAILLHVRDVSERVLLQEKIVRQRDRMQHYLDVTAGLFVVLDRDHHIEMINRHGCEMLGYAQTELLGRDWFDTCVPPRMAGEIRRLRGELLEGRGTAIEYFENPVIRRDGMERMIAWRNSIVRDADARVTKTVSFGLDITEGLREQDTLRRVTAAVEQTREMVVLADLAGHIEYMNPAFKALTGLPPGRELGSDLFPLLADPARNPRFRDAVRSNILKGVSWEGRIETSMPPGRTLHLDVIISPVRGPGGAIKNMAAVIRDVSEVVALQSKLFQSQKMEAVGQLAGGIAHDFNNLLMVIRGSSEFIRDALDPQSEPGRDIAEVLKASAAATTLVRQLLTFSRLQPLSPRTLDLNQLAGDLHGLTARLLGEKHFLSVDLNPEPALIRGDEAQLTQALLNLVINARDAMPNGGTIRIAIRRLDQAGLDPAEAVEASPAPEGPVACVCVSDNGPGVEPRLREKIFEPFFTTKQRGRGTGLGLSAVLGTVRQHGGCMGLVSTPGMGASFRMYVPLYEGEVELTRPEAAVPRGTETVLLVEDEAMVRRVEAAMLRQLGYTVIEAANAQEAIAALKRGFESVRLMLTDVMMPGMDGLELMEYARILRPDLPVIFSSGYPQHHLAELGKIRKNLPLLQKPFDLNTLAIALRAELDRAAKSGK